MKKKYKIKITKQLLKKLKSYWKEFKKIQDKFYKEQYELEKKAQKETGIGIEFFKVDGECVGIGNYERTMKLIHSYELEK